MFLHNWINSAPQSFRTPPEAWGSGLSGKCRRAIARARFRLWRRQWNKLTAPKFLSDAKLLPQERFEHPNLCLPPDDITLAIAERLWSGLLGKACAGLNSKHRASGAEALSELRSGSVSDRVRGAMRWAGSGMPEDAFLAMIGSSSLPFNVLVAGLREVYGDRVLGYAGYLNRWAKKPMNPPSFETHCIYMPNDMLLAGDAPRATYELPEHSSAFRMASHPKLGRHVFVFLGHMRYTWQLDAFHRARRLWAGGGIGTAKACA